MMVPILFNKELKQAEIQFVGRANFDFLQGWKAALGLDTHPVRADAVTFASLACKRFTAHFPVENYAQQAEDIADYVRDNPNCEVASLVVMKSDWFPESEVMGLAHFRRSWCNNLILDYLAAHPWIASKPPQYANHVRGVSTALLVFISEIGQDTGARQFGGNQLRILAGHTSAFSIWKAAATCFIFRVADIASLLRV